MKTPMFFHEAIILLATGIAFAQDWTDVPTFEAATTNAFLLQLPTRFHKEIQDILEE